MVGNRTAINTFHNSLRPDKLYKSFFIDPPSTYQEAMTRALNPTQAEETYRMCKEEESRTNQRDKRLHPRRDDQGKGKAPDRKVPSFARLNQPITEVIKYL